MSTTWAVKHDLIEADTELNIAVHYTIEGNGVVVSKVYFKHIDITAGFSKCEMAALELSLEMGDLMHLCGGESDHEAWRKQDRIKA